MTRKYVTPAIVVSRCETNVALLQSMAVGDASVGSGWSKKNGSFVEEDDYYDDEPWMGRN